MNISLYRGFLLGEEPIGNWRAYRNEDFMVKMIPTFEAPSTEELIKKIDDAGDYGEFTEKQSAGYAGDLGQPIISLITENGSKSIEEQISERIHELPFMPEPGPPLPKEVQEALGYKQIAAPVSAYGRAVRDDVLSALQEFLNTGNFVVIEDFDETGWASDSVIYEGIIRHTPTNMEWWVEIMANFEWRKPKKLESMDINFMSKREVGGENKWDNKPEEYADSGDDKWIFDLDASEGIRASTQVNEFRNTGWRI